VHVYHVLAEISWEIVRLHPLLDRSVRDLPASLGFDLEELKVPQDALKRFIASCNSMTNNVTYLEGLV
jgi:hypothetical protein